MAVGIRPLLPPRQMLVSMADGVYGEGRGPLRRQQLAVGVEQLAGDAGKSDRQVGLD